MTVLPLPTTLIVSLPSVPSTVTVSAAPSPVPLPAAAQVEFDLRHVGAGQVVDGDRCRRRPGR